MSPTLWPPSLLPALCASVPEAVQEGFSSFSGTDRRFQYKGTIGDVTIIDDYAHHPTEIRATLTAARNYPHKTLWCVFQPHTYTRTKALLDDFAQAPHSGGQGSAGRYLRCQRTKYYRNIVCRPSEENPEIGNECHYFPSFDEIENFLLKNCSPGDLLITMGAGNVVNIGETLLGK